MYKTWKFTFDNKKGTIVTLPFSPAYNEWSAPDAIGFLIFLKNGLNNEDLTE